MNNHFIKNSLCSILLLVVQMVTINASATTPISERLYVGIGVAQSNLQLNNKNVTAVNNLGGQAKLENNGFGMDAFVGFKFDDHIALELGYLEMGSTNLNDGTTVQEFLEANSLYLDAVLSHSITSQIDIFAKAGVSSWEANIINTNETTEGVGLHYGAGFDINVYGNNARVLRVKWEHHEFNSVLLESTDSVSATIMFNF